MSNVQCYAGSGYPERPTAFRQEGGWLEVERVLGQQRTPSGLIFQVLAADGKRYRLVWEEAADRWAVERMSERSTST